MVGCSSGTRAAPPDDGDRPRTIFVREPRGALKPIGAAACLQSRWFKDILFVRSKK